MAKMTSYIAELEYSCLNQLYSDKLLKGIQHTVKEECIFGFSINKFKMSTGTLRVGYTSVHRHYTVRHVNGV